MDFCDTCLTYHEFGNCPRERVIIDDMTPQPTPQPRSPEQIAAMESTHALLAIESNGVLSKCCCCLFISHKNHPIDQKHAKSCVFFPITAALKSKQDEIDKAEHCLRDIACLLGLPDPADSEGTSPQGLTSQIVEAIAELRTRAEQAGADRDAAIQQVGQTAAEGGLAEGKLIAKLWQVERERDEALEALKPFLSAFLAAEKRSDYSEFARNWFNQMPNEWPAPDRDSTVTMGDCRRAKEIIDRATQRPLDNTTPPVVM